VSLTDLAQRTTTVSNLDNSFPEYGRLRSKTESCNILPGHQQRSARDSNWFFENPRPRSVTVTGTNENWTKVGVSNIAPGMEYYRNKSQSCESVRLSEDEAIAIKGKFRQIGHSVLATALMKKMTKKHWKTNTSTGLKPGIEHGTSLILTSSLNQFWSQNIYEIRFVNFIFLVMYFVRHQIFWSLRPSLMIWACVILVGNTGVIKYFQWYIYIVS
jgi:hypothetical protein